MRMTLLKVCSAAVQGLFVLLILFWVFLAAKLGYLRFVGGPERVRTYLVHISTFNPPFSSSALAPAEQIQAAYQGLFLLLAITWGLRELSTILRRRVGDP